MKKIVLLIGSFLILPIINFFVNFFYGVNLLMLPQNYFTKSSDSFTLLLTIIIYLTLGYFIFGLIKSNKVNYFLLFMSTIILTFIFNHIFYVDSLEVISIYLLVAIIGIIYVLIKIMRDLVMTATLLPFLLIIAANFFYILLKLF